MSDYEVSIKSEIPDDELLEMARNNVRVLVRCERVEQEEDFGPKINPGLYAVDVTKKTFEFLDAETQKPIASSAMEIAGTYNPDDDTWLWPWFNRSADKACAEVKKAYESMPELTDFVATKKFTISLTDADLLARWVALRMGWVGTFAAEYPDQPITFIAIEKLSPSQKGLNCVCCFGNDVTHKITVAALTKDLGVCNYCAQVHRDILMSKAEMDDGITYEEFVKKVRSKPKAKKAKPKEDDAYADFFSGSPCIGCGNTDGVIMAPHAGVCHLCALKAIDELTANGSFVTE